LGPTHRQVPAESNSPRFVSFVSDLIGVENLIPNPSPDAGGLHQTTSGDFLNVHPQFTVHPYWSSWQRRVNADVTRCVEKITPDTNPDQSAGKGLACWDRYVQRRRGSP
jgi:hypothetical protein